MTMNQYKTEYIGIDNKMSKQSLVHITCRHDFKAVKVKTLCKR